MSQSSLSDSATTKHLANLAAQLRDLSGTELLATRDRNSVFNLDLDGLLVDWSFQRIDQRAYELLLKVADEENLIPRIQDQIAGKEVNKTENRPALHTALRGTSNGLDATTTEELTKDVHTALRFASNVSNREVTGFWNDPFTDVLHLGIGGSHLGQKLLYTAFGPSNIQVHFLSNVDPDNVSNVLQSLDPRSTLIVVASKSLQTDEVLRNYESVKRWFLQSTNSAEALEHHCVCISGNLQNAAQLGRHQFHIPESVGGRYSIWSAMGLPVMISHGGETFSQFLAGAREIDHLTLTNPIEKNISLILALLAFWNINFLKIESHVAGTYVHRLRHIVPYLQQLELESNGKSIKPSGESVDDRTSVAFWGGTETDGQHAWHQFLHQGTSDFSIDLIAETDDGSDSSRSWQLANCLAQRHILFHGTQDPSDQPHRAISGKHGCNLFLLDKVDAKTLGKLIAIYEHKVAFLGLLWNVNAFDQFGVEHGKALAGKFHRLLTTGNASELTESEQDLIDRIRLTKRR